MTKYAVVNTKGGVGKTTTGVHLATHLAYSEPTLLIDGDPQETAATWAAWRRDSDAVKGKPSPTTTCLRGKAIFDEGKQLSKGFVHTVVDAGGRDAPGLRNALLLADLAIVPVGASGFDAAAMTDLLEVVDLAKDYNPELRVKILLTRIDPRTKDGKEMLEFLQESKLDVLNARVCERVAFRRATSEGSTVEEIGKDSQAVAEMTAFYEEVKA
ncbi:ParA family protein [Xanthomonas euvesicatoria pv. euvesicatoria]|uniref:ParA family protein n=1 Tax=Xanthomonas TaxID=338 RepID=UPI0009384F14|nr:ParA family protein [Xanthomonas euvesicatoria]APO88894.1 partition protein [Xanthomonas euvesicatoria]MCC8518300.1 ParA family protein [Xanthomonas euvesicatoria pv. euvesicatoria]MCC8545957.1 ParA family protein [Xanthomonas euvesicatoria pv. euvesicatoria]MCC8613255.1 ParA family protein [Xanthomonas euvesicatoria pv. euvesicatoria]